MSESFAGWGQLGNALFGGGDRSGAYMKGAQGAAQLERMLAEARIKRDEALQRSKVAETLTATGMDPAQAQMLSTVFGAGYNPAQLGDYQRDQQTIGITGEAADAARGGNLDLLNNLATVLSGKPRERTQITGGMAFDPFAPPTQGMQTTPTGLADIAATLALGRERDAGARQNDAGAAENFAQATAAQAQADLRGRTDPNIRVASGGKDKPSSLLTAPPPPTYVPKPGEVSLEAALRGEGLPPEVIAQIGRAAESGQDFSVTVPPAGRPAPRPGVPAAAAAPAAKPPARQFSKEDALQSLKDAREAVRRGLVTKEEARRRLRDAGMTRTAEMLK